jgi:excisionase family DNA binding protein
MTVREAAQRLEITPALVYKLCRLGKMPHRRYGVGRGVVRITEGDLAIYLEMCRVEVRQEEPAQRARGPRYHGPRPKREHF